MGQFTQEDPIGIAGGLNLYGFANGDPINFSDPFGLCAKDEDGNEDPECRAVINILAGLAARDGIEDDARSQLQGAIQFYEGLTTGDVEFRYLPERAECCDNSVESRRFQAGGARGPYIWLNSALGVADLGLTAYHESLHSGQRLGDSSVYPKQAQVYSGLPGWLRSQAVQTGRLLRSRGYIR